MRIMNTRKSDLTTCMGIAALTLVQSCQYATAQSSLVVNGTFDTDASGWTINNVSQGGGYLSSAGNPAGSVFLYDGKSPPFAPTASQEISGLIPGADYIVSGDYRSGSENTVTGNGIGVALDGVYFFESTLQPDLNWYSFNFEFTADSTSALLSLSSQIDGSSATCLIDNISMQAVPEPDDLYLMGMGGALLVWKFKRRTKTAK